MTQANNCPFGTSMKYFTINNLGQAWLMGLIWHAHSTGQVLSFCFLA